MASRPLSAATALSTPPPEAAPALRAVRRSGPRIVKPKLEKGAILAVDDEPTTLRSIERILNLRGYEVTAVCSGDAAIAALANREFDAVLTDIAMPGADGIDVLRAVRGHNLDVPVVLITGAPAVSTAVKALEYGAFHYLTKPLDKTELEQVVDRAVCLRRMTQMKQQAAELLGNKEEPSLRELELSFQRALSSLWIAYQPIVSSRGRSLYGYEALLRSSEKTLPHPGAVLDAAEELGRLEELGRTIRAHAGAPFAGREAPGYLFVNLHTDDMLDPTLFDPDAPLSRIASRVVLEITERESLDRVKDLRTRITALRELGFRIAVDDLGAGYSGLTSFALLEPEIVKLDMTLIRDIHLSSTKQKLTRSITALCKDMGMLVVAEGVETADERDAVIDLGCDLLQGYYFAKPGPAFPEVTGE